MTIKVKMTPEEYDDYRAYQKEKKTLEEKAYYTANGLRSNYRRLCDQILTALRVNDNGELRTVEIVDVDAALGAFEEAQEWFA